MEEDALELAIRSAGGAAVVAREFGISSQAISQWKRVPANRVISLETLSGISRHVLRPDIFGPAPKAAKKGKAA